MAEGWLAAILAAQAAPAGSDAQNSIVNLANTAGGAGTIGNITSQQFMGLIPSGGGGYPSAVPAANLSRTPTFPGAGGAGTPVAQGFEIFQMMLDNVLRAEQLRQSAIDQQVNIANLFAGLQKSSPTQAADLATSLGLPGLEPDLSFANRFASKSATGTFGGTVGTQNIRLPFAFSGKDISFLGQNPNVANILTDIGARFGRPDVLGNSIASLIPAGSSLFKV